MPRRARRRRRVAAADELTPGMVVDLVCGPTPRGSAFGAPDERERLRRLHAVPRSRSIAARERQLDAARAAFAAARTTAATITRED